MVTVTRVIGAALIVVGVAAYVGTGMEHVTAAAPAGFGLLILVFGLLAGKPSLHRHMIHAALVVALFGLVGSIRPLMQIGEDSAAPIAGGALALLCLVYLVLGVRSFVAARREREPSA